MLRERPEPKEESFEAKAEQETLDDLRRKINELVEKGDYAAAEGEIKKELSNLAGAFGYDLRKLREKFESTLGPETRELINPEGPELRGRAAKQHAEQLARVEALSRKEEAEINQETEGSGNTIDKIKFVEKLSWDVPRLDEIIPGLILEMQIEKPGSSFKRIEYFEVLTDAKTEKFGDDPMIKVKDLSTGRHVYKTLAELGILPYISNSLWDAQNHPAKWYMKTKLEDKEPKRKRKKEEE